MALSIFSAIEVHADRKNVEAAVQVGLVIQVRLNFS